MRVNQYVEWQPNPDDREETGSIVVHNGAVPSVNDAVKLDGNRYRVSELTWSIFRRPDAPGGGAIDIYAVVRLIPSRR